MSHTSGIEMSSEPLFNPEGLIDAREVTEGWTEEVIPRQLAMALKRGSPAPEVAGIKQL
jgi:hypothetical protein